MSKLEPALDEIRIKYGLLEDDFWPLKRDGKTQWLVKHKSLERVAAALGITFDTPQIIEACSRDKVSVMVVTGWLEKSSAWSFGEAAPHNNKNSYPFAMAEKRAKDRVILKLIGIHGYVYSEDESDEFRESNPDNNPEAYEKKKDGTLKNAKGFTNGQMNSAGKRRTIEDLTSDMADVHTYLAYQKLRSYWMPIIEKWRDSEDEIEVTWKSLATDLFKAKREEIGDVEES